MATQEQIADLLHRLQQQEGLTAALQAQNNQLVEQQHQQAATFGQQLAAQLASLPQSLAAALQSTSHARARPNLIDLRGLGKPEKFDNKEESFVMWARRTQNFIAGAYPEAREILAQAAELEEAATVESIDTEELPPTQTTLENSVSKCTQRYCR